MNITTDEETFSDIEMVRRNLAHFAPLKTTFRARPEVNTRIMERITLWRKPKWQTRQRIVYKSQLWMRANRWIGKYRFDALRIFRGGTIEHVPNIEIENDGKTGRVK